MSKEEQIIPVPQEDGAIPVHFLTSPWVFWYLIPNRSGASPSTDSDDWTQFLHPLHSFQTIEDFGRILNSVEHPSKLLKGCRYYVARRAMKPVWEDPSMNGGHFVTSELDKEPDRSQEMETKWIDIILDIFEGKFPFKEEIMAIEYTSRPTSWRITIWAGSRCDDVNKIANKMQQIMGDIPVIVQDISAD